MKNNAYLKIIPIGLASISIIISLLLCGQIIGFDQAISAINRTNEINSAVKLDHPGGPDAHILFGGIYTIIVICFCVYIITKLKERNFLLGGAAIIPVGIIICLFWKVFQLKNDYLRENGVLIYYNWIRYSISFDWLCVVIAGILLILQIGIVFSNYRSLPK